MHRRRFLVVGVAGAAALSAAGLWTWLARERAAGASDADRSAVLAAIVPVLLDGALPAAGLERQAAIRETVNGVGQAIDGLPPATRAELAQLFTLLGLPVGRRVFAGVGSPWPQATPDEIGAFLAAWQASAWSLKRSAYDALHQLVLATWYGQPRAWPAIGYPGPPPLGGPS